MAVGQRPSRGIVPRDGLSHVSGSTQRPLIEGTIPSFLKSVVSRHGARTAAVFCQSGERWTYEQLSRRVDRLAAGLLSLGLYKGDRIGIWSPNRAEWLLVQLATARIGLVLVNINPAYRTSELEYALNKVGAKALVLARQFKSSSYVDMLREISPELDAAVPGRLRAERAPTLTTVITLGAGAVPGAFTFDAVMDRGQGGPRARLDAISASLNPHDAVNIQFTSGTTGAPKGATLSHHNIVNNAISCARAMRLSPGEGLCIPVPLYHCFGMVLGNLSAAAYGVKMVFPGEAFDALETLQAIATERCNAVHGVPTMFAAMLDHPRFREFDLSSLRTGIMAGAPCPAPLMRRVLEDMHCAEITIAYGMTETSPISFQSDVDDPATLRVETVGRVQPHVEVKIVDADGRTVPVGETGELLTRGYVVMKGYWDDDERTREVLTGGWMHTGDLGTLDKQGYCRIVGRSKDMVIRGGENIYPAEVESFLGSHPAISDVQVFGVPDSKYGEELCAWIVPTPGAILTEQAVRDYCDSQIAHFKIPRFMSFVPEFPMTVTGKPQKFKMREQAMRDLSLS